MNERGRERERVKCKSVHVDCDCGAMRERCAGAEHRGACERKKHRQLRDKQKQMGNRVTNTQQTIQNHRACSGMAAEKSACGGCSDGVRSTRHDVSLHYLTGTALFVSAGHPDVTPRHSMATVQWNCGISSPSSSAGLSSAFWR